MLLRRNCAFRADGNGGGSSCSEISSEDKIYIGIIAALCGVVLAACASWVLIKRHLSRRASAREAHSATGSEPEMGQYGRAPLLSASPYPGYPGHTGSFAPTHSPNPSVSEPPYSPYADSHSSHSHSSHSHSHGSQSLGSHGSRTPSEFHFPILSADGHLLPPAPASARAIMGVEVNMDRPLPEPPAFSAPSSSPNYEPPGSDVEQTRGTSRLVGLWPETLSLATRSYAPYERTEVQDYDVSHEKDQYPSYSSRPGSIMSTPRLSPGLEYGQVRPHRAVVHRSFSSEGQEYDLGVRH